MKSKSNKKYITRIHDNEEEETRTTERKYMTAKVFCGERTFGMKREYNKVRKGESIMKLREINYKRQESNLNKFIILSVFCFLFIYSLAVVSTIEGERRPAFLDDKSRAVV